MLGSHGSLPVSAVFVPTLPLRTAARVVGLQVVQLFFSRKHHTFFSFAYATHVPQLPSGHGYSRAAEAQQLLRRAGQAVGLRRKSSRQGSWFSVRASGPRAAAGSQSLSSFTSATGGLRKYLLASVGNLFFTNVSRTGNGARRRIIFSLVRLCPSWHSIVVLSSSGSCRSSRARLHVFVNWSEKRFRPSMPRQIPFRRLLADSILLVKLLNQSHEH